MRSATVSLGLIGGISALGIPLFETLQQDTITGHVQRELVSSSGLQDLIDVNNLLDRAKTLYSIAERGIDEYNHPTRVIGSKGMSELNNRVPSSTSTHTLTFRTSRNIGLYLLNNSWAGRLLRCYKPVFSSCLGQRFRVSSRYRA